MGWISWVLPPPPQIKSCCIRESSSVIPVFVSKCHIKRCACTLAPSVHLHPTPHSTQYVHVHPFIKAILIRLNVGLHLDSLRVPLMVSGQYSGAQGQNKYIAEYRKNLHTAMSMTAVFYQCAHMRQEQRKTRRVSWIWHQSGHASIPEFILGGSPS